MKKLPIFLIIIILFSGVALGLSQKNRFLRFNFFNKNIIQIQDLKTLEIKEVYPETFGFKTLDSNKIEIGTEKLSQPYLKLDKWEGEIFLKIDIPFETKEKPILKGNRITYSTVNIRYLAQGNWWQRMRAKVFAFAQNFQEEQPRVDIVFYPREPEELTEKDSQGKEHKILQNEQGGVEFDTILYEKPETNKIPAAPLSLAVSTLSLPSPY